MYSGSSWHGIALRANVDTGFDVLFYASSGSVVGSITHTLSGTAFNTTSDGTLKDDLQSADAVSFAVIDNIKIYDFRWTTSDTRGIGAIAKELEKIEPRAVAPGRTETTQRMLADGTKEETQIYLPWGVDYSVLVPHLISYVQQLEWRIAALEGT